MEKTIRVCDHPECIEADEVSDVTREFELQGQKRKIDLCHSHDIQFLAFQEQAKSWYERSREVEKPARVRTPESREKRSNRSKTANIRSWARQNGYDVAERGRLNPDIVTAYEKAKNSGHLSAVPS